MIQNAFLFAWDAYTCIPTIISSINLKNLEIIAPKDSELTLLVAEKTTILKDLRY